MRLQESFLRAWRVSLTDPVLWSEPEQGQSLRGSWFRRPLLNQNRRPAKPVFNRKRVNEKTFTYNRSLIKPIPDAIRGFRLGGGNEAADHYRAIRIQGRKDDASGRYLYDLPYRRQRRTWFLDTQRKRRGEVLFITQSVQTRDVPAGDRLEFRRFGDQYFLARFWWEGDNTGRELAYYHVELEIAGGPAVKIEPPEVISIAQ